MNKRTVTIGPVFLVRSAGIAQVLQTKQKDYPHLPDPLQIEIDINILNDEGGVPAVVVLNAEGEKMDKAERKAGKAEPAGEAQPSPLPYTRRLFLYTPSYVLELGETKNRNGYYIEHIEPVHVQMYDRLAQGALALSATRWHLCDQEQDIPNSQSSHWQLLEEEWQHLQEQIQQVRDLASHHPFPLLSVLPPHHERFLDLATSLIENTPQPANTTDDHKQSDTHISAQQAAISRLKQGKAANPHLLSVLVDHSYQPYQVAAVPLQIEPLSRELEELVSKGLSVPDLLLVHAPTTERVQAIVQLVRACTAQRQRILLVAHTQASLLDLLVQMPEKLLTLHLQKTPLQDEKLRSLSVNVRARAVQKQLLERTEAALPHLTRLAVSKKTIDQWIERLQRHIATLNNEETARQVAALRRRMVEIEQFISSPFVPMLSEIAAAIQQLEENLAHQKQRLNTVTGRQAATEELRQKVTIGRLLNGVEQLGQNWLKRQRSLVESLQAEYDARKQAYQQAQETMQQVIREDPEYAWCLQRLQEAETERTTALAEATKAVSILQETLRELVPDLPPLENLNELMLQQYLNWYMVTRALLVQRYDLLEEWRTRFSKHAERLYPELVRYADVVCATPADLVATKELGLVDFDLVIVEDASSMPLPDLLLSLVRARRAILIGDEQQLLPSSEQTQTPEQQFDEEQEQQIKTYLTQSAFAQLWSSPIDLAHTVRLTTPDDHQAETQAGSQEQSEVQADSVAEVM